MNVRSFAAARTPARSLSVGPVILNAIHAFPGAVKSQARALLNRRTAGRLEHLSDYELSDIGLTRDDLRFGRSMPIYSDPTVELARRARLNSY